MGVKNGSYVNLNLYVTLTTNAGKLWTHVETIMSNLTVTTSLKVSFCRCEFDLLKCHGIEFWEGDRIEIFDGGPKGVLIFSGVIFTKSRTQETDIIHCTAFDNIRYLENKLSFNYENLTCSQVFQQICQRLELPMGNVASSSIVMSKNYDHIAAKKIIQDSLDYTLVGSAEVYFVYTEGKKLCLGKSTDFLEKTIIGDASWLSQFRYTSSIEKAYNYVEIYTDVKPETGKGTKKEPRVLAIAEDPEKIKRWGKLGLYQKLSTQKPSLSAKTMADAALNLLCRPDRRISLVAVGDCNFRAGHLFNLRVKDLGDIQVDQKLLIETCKHHYQNGLHTMEITSKIVLEDEG